MRARARSRQQARTALPALELPSHLTRGSRRTDLCPPAVVTMCMPMHVLQVELMEQQHQGQVYLAAPGVPIVPVIKMLRDLCEDHHPAMQAAMYEQQLCCGTSRSVNLVQEALKLVECFAKTERRVDAMKAAGAAKLLAVFDFLIEASQGPCFRNQVRARGCSAPYLLNCLVPCECQPHATPTSAQQ
jgi:hypothetical protein